MPNRSGGGSADWGDHVPSFASRVPQQGGDRRHHRATCHVVYRMPKKRRSWTAVLWFTLVEIDAPCMDPWRCPCFEAGNSKTEGGKVVRQCNGGGLTCSSGRPYRGSGNSTSTEERPTGDDNSTGCVATLRMGHHMKAWRAGVCTRHERDNTLHHPLPNVEVRECFEEFLHDTRIEAFVALRTEGLDGGTFGFVEQTHLDKGTVGNAPNDAAEGVDFTHEMSFGGTANGWITRKMADFVQIDRNHQRGSAHARCGSSCFTARMTSADDNDVVYEWVQCWCVHVILVHCVVKTHP